MLLSINPKHVNNIFNGTKQFEFRKVVCTKNIDTIIFYATNPVQKIVGEAKVADIFVDTPSVIWEKTNKFSGISKSFFDKYFENRKIAVAFKVNNVKMYTAPKYLSDYGVKRAPQSFLYLD
jgi:predicted transcriptional regulator